jgi:hypothetical protein
MLLGIRALAAVCAVGYVQTTRTRNTTRHSGLALRKSQVDLGRSATAAQPRPAQPALPRPTCPRKSSLAGTGFGVLAGVPVRLAVGSVLAVRRVVAVGSGAAVPRRRSPFPRHHPLPIVEGRYALPPLRQRDSGNGPRRTSEVLHH